jgi:hypothetical protein
MCFGTSEFGVGCSKDGLGQDVPAARKICGFFIGYPRSAIRNPFFFALLCDLRVFLLIHLNGEVDFDGDIEGEGGGAEGGA